MSVLAVILIGVCATSVWADCGTCDRAIQCTQEPSEPQCEFGVVKDACNCCLQCAKGIGQPCGTGRTVAAGICAPGLICKLVSPRQPSRCDEDPRAIEKSVAVQELPADGTHGDNIQDTDAPEETEPTQPPGRLGPSRVRGQVPSESLTNPSQRVNTRNNQQQRPFRQQLGHGHPAQKPRTTESPAEAETESPVQETAVPEEVPSEIDAGRRTPPTANTQERQAPNTSGLGAPQRVRGQGSQNGRTRSEGHGSQNGRTRGEVPLLRERSSTTTTTEATVPEEVISPPQRGHTESHAADGPEHFQEKQDLAHTAQDAIEAREDLEGSHLESIIVEGDAANGQLGEGAVLSNVGEEVAHNQAGDEATHIVTGEGEGPRTEIGEKVLQSHTEVEAKQSDIGVEIIQSQTDEDTQSHTGEDKQSHTGEDTTESHTGEESIQSHTGEEDAQSHTDEETIQSTAGAEAIPSQTGEVAIQSHTGEEDIQSHKAEDKQSNAGEEVQLVLTQGDESHLRAEAEEPQPIVPEVQNRRPEGEAPPSNSRNDRSRNQSQRPLIRRSRSHREPTPRHEHEGSLQNLNDEDKNENYSHDNPSFDNRTTK